MAEIIAIDDADDPRIAPYRGIRERDLVGRDGHFIAEGAVVIRSLLQSALHRPVSLLLAAHRIARLGPFLDALPPGVPAYSASQAVIDRISGFPMHRGMLGLGRRGPEASAAEILTRAGTPSRVVVLFGLANHDNMGGIFRNAAAFGAAAIILDPTSCDPLYRKAIRVSVGASLLVPFARLGAEEDALALLDEAGFEAVALSPSGSTTLAELRPAARCALIVGTEGPGLPDAILRRSRTVRIPMADGFDSLNAATATGIALHHLAVGQDHRSRE